MKNKILGLLGILFIAFSIGTYFAYSNTIKNNSELFGKTVLVLSKDVRAGELITKNNVELRRIKISDLSSTYLVEDDLKDIVGKVAAINLSKNELLNKDRLTERDAFFPRTTRDIAVATNAISSLAGNIKKGDYVDVWGKSGEKDQVSKKLSNVKVVALKDSQNNDIEGIKGAVPSAVILRVTSDNQIPLIANLSNLFLTKDINQLGAQLETSKNNSSSTVVDQTPVEDTGNK